MSQTKPLKIAATDLTFLLNGCPCCFHHKIVNNWKAPYRPMPSVFTKIDRLMGEALNGYEVNHNDTKGTLNTKQVTVKSLPLTLDNGIEIFFSGRTDGEVSFEDSTFGISDAKTSNVKTQYEDLYWRQLHVYDYAYRHPAKGDPKQVSSLFLMPVVPAKMQVTPEGALFQFEMSEHIIPIDREGFMAFLNETVAPLLETAPPTNPNCPDCAVRESGWVKPAKKK